MSVDGCSQPGPKSQGLWLSSVTPQHRQDTRWNSLLYHWEIMCWHLLSNKVLLKQTYYLILWPLLCYNDMWWGGFRRLTCIVPNVGSICSLSSYTKSWVTPVLFPKFSLV